MREEEVKVNKEVDEEQEVGGGGKGAEVNEIT